MDFVTWMVPSCLSKSAEQTDAKIAIQWPGPCGGSLSTFDRLFEMVSYFNQKEGLTVRSRDGRGQSVC